VLLVCAEVRDTPGAPFPVDIRLVATPKPLSRPIEDCDGWVAPAGICDLSLDDPVQIVQFHIASRRG
jgi:hypothetical protein